MVSELSSICPLVVGKSVRPPEPTPSFPMRQTKQAPGQAELPRAFRAWFVDQGPGLLLGRPSNSGYFFYTFKDYETTKSQANKEM